MTDHTVVAPVRRARAQHNTATGERRSPRARSGTRQVGPPSAKRPVRMPEIVLGVLLVATCAMGALLWQRSVDQTITVVAAARPIARGSIISAADVRGAQVGGETSGLVRGDDARLIVGRIALVDIEQGVPFTSALVTDAAPLGPDEALTSMALSPGQMPTDLAPGDHVRLVVTAAPDATGVTETNMLESEATVWTIASGTDGLSTVVTVRGPLDLSTAVAAASKVQLARVEGN